MRDLFPGYYPPTKSELKAIWDTCLFVVDANVLLNFYRYTTAARMDFLRILEGLSDRLWMPHQVAEEFHRNRLKTIADNACPYKAISDKIDGFPREIQQLLEKTFRGAAGKPLSELAAKSIEPLKEEVAKLAAEHQDLNEHDAVLDHLDRLFDGNVGSGYTFERLQEVYRLGELRYANSIPPGFADKSKDGDRRRFGDLVLWMQVLDRAKADSKPIIIVTDDTKEDWFLRIGGKVAGPHPELINEMRREAGVACYIYAANQFVQLAGTYLRMPVKKQSVDEVKRVADEDGRRNVELLAERFQQLGAGVTAESSTGPRAIHIRLDPTKRERIRLLREALESHHGDAAVYLHLNDGLVVRKVESRQLTVDLSNGLASLLESLVGRQEVWVE